jgi:hypothetical protein
MKRGKGFRKHEGAKRKGERRAMQVEGKAARDPGVGFVIGLLRVIFFLESYFIQVAEQILQRSSMPFRCS